MAKRKKAGGTGGPTSENIAAVERLTGWTFTPEQRDLMLEGLAEQSETYRLLRIGAPDYSVPPALQFNPRAAGQQGRAGIRAGKIRLPVGKLPPYNGNPDSLAFRPAHQLARLLRARKVTSLELTEMYLRRLQEFGPRLHCVVNLTTALAREQAVRADSEIAAGRYRGPLHGIPWGCKDLLATRGTPTTWGVKIFEEQVFDEDATIVRRLEEAGAVLIAKLSMGELAMGDVWFGGMTRSPWDLEQGASGSSAGSGSATAAGLVGFSIGTETFGSIVSPSVRNGVTGLRPTFGRVSRHGAMPLSWSLDKIGPMCRSALDCALVFEAIQGDDGLDPSARSCPFHWSPRTSPAHLRVGIDEGSFALIQNDRSGRRVYEQALAELRTLGVELRPIQLPQNDKLYCPLVWLTIQAESAASFTGLIASGRLDELVQQEAHSWPNLFRAGTFVPAADYINAQRLRTQLQHEMAQLFNEIDCYVTIPARGPSLYYSNLVGYPEIVLRCGFTGRRPRSISFVGGLDREDAILTLAHAYQSRTKWHRRNPRLVN